MTFDILLEEEQNKSQTLTPAHYIGLIRKHYSLLCSPPSQWDIILNEAAVCSPAVCLSLTISSNQCVLELCLL